MICMFCKEPEKVYPALKAYFGLLSMVLDCKYIKSYNNLWDAWKRVLFSSDSSVSICFLFNGSRDLLSVWEVSFLLQSDSVVMNQEALNPKASGHMVFGPWNRAVYVFHILVLWIQEMQVGQVILQCLFFWKFQIISSGLGFPLEWCIVQICIWIKLLKGQWKIV